MQKVLKLTILALLILTIKSSAPDIRAKVVYSYETKCWTGYVSEGAYTSISGMWTEPEVTAPPQRTVGEVNMWVGIEGDCRVGDKYVAKEPCKKLIQIGTDAAFYSQWQSDSHFVWYELYPASPIIVNDISIDPGDVITASIKLVSGKSKRQVWELAIIDISKNEKWSKKVSFNLSEGYADWLVESAECKNPLANFKKITFQQLNVDNGAPKSLIRLTMEHPDGQTANPSLPNSKGNFSVCWGSGKRLVPCSPSNK